MFSFVPPSGLHRRLFLFGLAAVVAFLFLGGRLWHLQVNQGDHYRNLSDHNRIRLKRVKATRGLIFDRDGEVLVENRPSYDVIMVPEDAEQPKKVIDRLERYLEEPLPGAHEALSRNGSRPPFEPVVVKSDVDWETLVTVETRQLELPGISLSIGPRRSYLYGRVLAHLLGYMGEVSGEELRKREGYRMGDTIGRYGLEKRWESYLRGENGGQQIEVDAIGRELRVLREVEATPGSHLFLTVDVDLQKAAFDALEGHAGSIVAIEPGTGAILAMVSRPAFDPNQFANGIAPKAWNELLRNPLRPISDRALQGQYPPGSVFKIVTAAAALEEGIVTPFTRLFCGGHLRFGRRNFQCWKRGGHGWMNLHQAIVESCDVYFYQVGQRLGVDAIAEYARRFGLGQPTGVAIDHEKTGTVPDSKWKKRVFGEPWYPGETLSVAIGQGSLTATPLQVANLVAAVAAGGKRREPHMVDRIETAAGEILRPGEKTEAQDLGLRPSTLTQIRSALRDVVESKKGTGKQARVSGIEVAGKTGTAQTVRLRQDQDEDEEIPREARDHAWFTAYAPADDPEIVVAVLLENAGESGGKVAAPVVGKVLAHYFGVNENQKKEEDDGPS